MVASPVLNRSHKLAILVFFFLNLLILLTFRQVQPFHVLLFIILFLVWCSPGYLFAMIANKENERRGPFFWILALVAGYHLSSIFVVLMAQLFTVPIWLMAFVMTSVLLSVFLVFHDRILGEARKFRFSRAGLEGATFYLILFLSAVFIFLIVFPHTQAGKISPNGLEYHDLYSTVFFKHVSITSELTKNIPPENPFFFGEKLHYYWLFYVFPAIAHNALHIPIEEALFLLTWAITITALFSILILVHAFSTRTTDLVFAVTPLLFAYSYEGILVLSTLQQTAQPLSKFTSVNIDAATRTYFSTPEVIGVYRAFVFDPHHMFAISLMIVCFLLFRRVLQKFSWIVAASALFLLGGIAGHSAFIAYTAVTWILIWLMIELFRRKASFLMNKKFVLSGLGIVLFYTVIYFGFPGLYEAEASNLDFGLLPKSSPFMLVDFGALLVLGILGLILAIKKKDDRVLPIAVLLLVGFIQLFFTFFPEWPNDLSMKTGHSISLALACLGAHFFSKQASGSKRRRIAKLGFAFLILPALPTIGMDWYNLQQSQSSQSNTLIANEDLDACQWINKNLPQNAIVQSFPYRQGLAFYSLIPTFAERRAALGDPMHSRIFQGDTERNKNRRSLINLLFLSKSSEVASHVAKNLGIEYVYFGSAERRLFAEGLTKFRDSNFFERVYANRIVRIFRLNNERQLASKDSYDEHIDLSAVRISFRENFRRLSSEDIWKAVEWSGTSGAALSLNTTEDFSGVMLFRIKASSPMRIEISGNQFFEPIRTDSRWQWIELPKLSLMKGQNNLRFSVPNDPNQSFVISEVFFFGTSNS